MLKNEIATYQKKLKLKNASFTKIEHDDAMVATVYQVDSTNQKPSILKICKQDNDYFREVYFLNRFQDMLPVPKVLQTIEPAKDVSGAILMECMPGTLLNHTVLTDELACEIGECLARIHQQRLSGYGDLMLGQLNSDPRIYFTQKFTESVEECRPHLSEDLLKKCRQFYESHVNELLTTDGPCLVHRDFRLGNMLVHQGQLSGIIDWSSTRVSFAEEDFCFLEQSQLAEQDSHIQSFLTGYAAVRPVPDYKKIMPLLRVSKALATMGFMLKEGLHEGKHAFLYQANQAYLETLFNESKVTS